MFFARECLCGGKLLHSPVTIKSDISLGQPFDTLLQSCAYWVMENGKESIDFALHYFLARQSDSLALIF